MADSNGHNNTFFNLSLMPGSLNCAKGDIVSRFKVPVYLTTAYVSEEYRVLIIWNTVKTSVGAGSASLHLLCKDADEYVDCLRSLSRIEPEWYQASRDKKGWKKNDNLCAYSDIGKSIAAQIELSKIEKGLFDPYTIGGLEQHLKICNVEQLIVCERA